MKLHLKNKEAILVYFRETLQISLHIQFTHRYAMLLVCRMLSNNNSHLML